MKTFFKANIASLSASLCDYVLTIIFKKFLLINAVVSSIIGSIFGGTINFFDWKTVGIPIKRSGFIS